MGMTRANVLAVPLALLLVGLLEAAHLPGSLYAADPVHAARALAMAIYYGFGVLLGPILFQLALAAGARLRWRASLRAAASVVLAGVSATVPYITLVGDDVFAGYPPLVALHVALFVFLAWAAFEHTAEPRATGALRRWGPTVCGLVGFAVAYVANYRLHWGAYATLHVSVLQSSALLLQVGLAGLLGVVVLPRWSVVGLGVAAVALAGGVVATAGGWADPVRPHFLEHTVLGAGVTGRVADAPAVDGDLAAPDDEAEARFARHSGLPRLPDDFRTADYNVLWIAGEATRFDQTSFARPDLETTPRLDAWTQASEAHVFTRAWSPGCGTLQSLSSVHGMSWLTAVPVDVRKKVWLGRLRDETETVAEVFSAAGYDTFWVGHNLRGHFTHDIEGFAQGFRTRALVTPDGDGTGDVDRTIADRAIAEVTRARPEGKRFFGWLFFASPHSPYGAHEPARPAASRLDRYRQELRFMDAQIARVLDALQASGAAERTIVIFFGDHGEAFGEHGTRFHMRTLHAEVTHVPLVVRVPGMAGGRATAPTSPAYVFPWLFLRGTESMRQAAQARLTREIGPMMRATGGAVLTELVSHRTMRVALVYPEHKVHYDFRSQRLTVFDTTSDPGERTDLAVAHPELDATYRARVRRYRGVRAALQRLTLAGARDGLVDPGGDR